MVRRSAPSRGGRQLAALFAARDLAPCDLSEWTHLPLPILRSGRLFGRAAAGPLGGFPAICGELLIRSGGASDVSQREYLFAAFQIPPGSASRHPGVSVRRRGSGSPSGIEGSEVEFESQELARMLEVTVAPDADPVATRELFGPQLVAALCDAPVEWDQRGDRLLVFERATPRFVQEFDRFCAAAVAVARAYWSDQR